MTRETIPAAPPVPTLITVRQLHTLLGELMEESPEIADYSVLTASDPEGNRFRGLPEDPTRVFGFDRVTSVSWRGVQIDDELEEGTENALTLWPVI